MAAKEERKFILECLRLYKTLPALWNTKAQDYRNRMKKNEQYNQLLRKYRERYPNADRNQLVKKLNVLRTNYRKELKRINNLITAGAHQFKTTLWYFDELQFLEDLKAPCNLESAVKIEIGDDVESEVETASSNIVESDRDSLNPTPRNLSIRHLHKYTINLRKRQMNPSEHEKVADNFVLVEDNPPKKKLNRKENSRDKVKLLAHRRIQQPAQSETECERIALAWATDLEKMRPLQQLFAKKAINDILFEGQMGTLHRDSVQINRKPLILPSGESTPFSAVLPSPVTYE